MKKNTIVTLVGFGFIVVIMFLIINSFTKIVEEELKILESAKEEIVDVDSTNIDTANDGKLIATNGTIINNGVVKDDDFNISIKVLALNRVVEVYEKKEVCETEEDSEGNSYKECHYEYDWVKKIANVNGKYIDSHYSYSNNVTLNKYVITSNLLAKLSLNKYYTNIDKNTLNKYNLKQSGHYYIDYSDTSSYTEGDFRISFVYSDINEATIVGVQQGNTIKPYSKNGKTIYFIEEGKYNGKDLIQKKIDNLKNVKSKLNIVYYVFFGIIGVVVIVCLVSSFKKKKYNNSVITNHYNNYNPTSYVNNQYTNYNPANQNNNNNNNNNNY